MPKTRPCSSVFRRQSGRGVDLSRRTRVLSGWWVGPGQLPDDEPEPDDEPFAPEPEELPDTPSPPRLTVPFDEVEPRLLPVVPLRMLVPLGGAVTEPPRATVPTGELEP